MCTLSYFMHLYLYVCRSEEEQDQQALLGGHLAADLTATRYVYRRI